MITLFILFAAIAILAWGFYRARPFGKLGILAWLQSVALMAPWLLVFGALAVGVTFNLAIVLLLLLLSIAVYILLGRQLRASAEQAGLINPVSSQAAASSPSSDSSPSSEEATIDRPATESTRTTQPPGAKTADAPLMPAEEIQTIKGIFGIETFFATETIPYQEGVIFKGNLRGEVQPSFDRLTANLQERTGDRYRLFLLEGLEGKPVVIVLPRAPEKKSVAIAQWILSLVLIVATIATCLETSGLLRGFDFFSELTRWREVLPVASGILLVLAATEIAHRITAARQQIRLSPPYFIPTWQIGSFGSFFRFESVLPDRNRLFDVAFAGSAAGGAVSLSLLVVGLLLSRPDSLFQLPANFFEGSLLVGSLARIVLGETLKQSLVAIHPLVLVGWIGLVVTAINLMPAGQLNGGRIVQAIYGRKVAGRTTIATVIVLGLASLVNPLALYWAVLILFLQRDLERPALNELTEPDDARAALGLLALFLMAATLLPITPGLAGRLGIGSSF
ncbi:site-2 protease family protein [Leptolyngbya sp. FACHB-711]|uniref:site-2 protease family protein n=1 Tax=Leptolyngbya sp. FACHB-711 TaxID=2692813 RepID=UPI0016835AEC|nr:site-2 protease family protein [Leptolyngbya sp. FACHB-711]MBD1852916.1 site-2 protease family protein [Cyanobacteria bacterium FACHB-502]MBD2024818.1 site-2 protease family protein [Leptolyngbya sp. FACHB-711]